VVITMKRLFEENRELLMNEDTQNEIMAYVILVAMFIYMLNMLGII
jgi:hypothetical protein